MLPAPSKLDLPRRPSESLSRGSDWTLRRLEDLCWPLLSAGEQNAYLQALAALRLSFWEAYWRKVAAVTDRDDRQFRLAYQALADGVQLAGKERLDEAARRGTLFGTPRRFSAPS